MRNFSLSKILVLMGLILLLVFFAAAYASGDVKNYMQGADVKTESTGGALQLVNDKSKSVKDVTYENIKTEVVPEPEDGGKIIGEDSDSIYKDKPARIIDPNKPMIALTFDDGPHPKYTGEILDTLKEHNALATFFVLGSRAEKCRDTIKSIADSGNQIGNHTYDHKELTKLTIEDIKNEIVKTKDILKDIDNINPDIVRPTYGSVNDNVKLYAGAPLILWSIDTLDWKTRNSGKIVQEALKSPKDGDIILMHDIYQTTADAVKVIVKELSARGYQLVTIDELYAARGKKLENGKVYSKCQKPAAVSK